MEGEEGEQNGTQNRMEKDKLLEEDYDLLGRPLTINTQIQLIANCHRATIIIQTTSTGDQCDLNLSPVQSGRQIIELLAAMEIDRPERQNINRCSAYHERPRQCAQSRSPETQDRVQGRLRSTLELIQNYLIRAGDEVTTQFTDSFVKCWNPKFAIPKKQRGWRKIHDCRIPISELITEYFKLEGISDIHKIIISNDWATTIDLHHAFHHIRVADEMRPYLCYIFNGISYSYNVLPDSRGKEAMQLENLRLRRRYFDPELVEHENIDDANDNIPKQKSVEATKTSDGTSQVKEARKNKRLGIGN
ncbi:MAG: hypothetical protein EZS28_044789 [Streblomastix strix]|uniref:Reverse transcriptase domain-containing protein n=1 Tax=Streblomastix strix TaxID=222440 RepID=A0A5J4TQP1_9EUKA|nr:MAG: hypothetical protein EZS28_044789 [Streblomastix strix]